MFIIILIYRPLSTLFDWRPFSETIVEARMRIRVFRSDLKSLSIFIHRTCYLFIIYVNQNYKKKIMAFFFIFSIFLDRKFKSCFESIFFNPKPHFFATPRSEFEFFVSRIRLKFSWTALFSNFGVFSIHSNNNYATSNGLGLNYSSSGPTVTAPRTVPRLAPPPMQMMGRLVIIV